MCVGVCRWAMERWKSHLSKGWRANRKPALVLAVVTTSVWNLEWISRVGLMCLLRSEHAHAATSRLGARRHVDRAQAERSPVKLHVTAALFLLTVVPFRTGFSAFPHIVLAQAASSSARVLVRDFLHLRLTCSLYTQTTEPILLRSSEEPPPPSWNCHFFSS